MTTQIRVLYVDDEDNLLELGKRYLERIGDFLVIPVLGVAEAIDQLKQNSFDVIISDYQMPIMDGIAFLKHLKAEGDTTPFILFTGRGREEVVIEALNNGADFYLQKGGDLKSLFVELSNKIYSAVSRRRAELDLLRKNEELHTAYEEIAATEEELRANLDELVRNELDLRNSRQELSDIINFLPDATFVINLEGIVVAWNRAIEEMTGIPSEQMIGRGNYEYALPFYHERRKIMIDLIFHDDPVAKLKYPGITKKGRYLFSEIFIPHLNEGRGAYLWFKACPLYDAEGNFKGAIESIRDITGRKNTEAALKQDELHLETLLTFYQMYSAPLKELMNFAIEKAVEFSASSIGYIAFVNEDETILTMYAWSEQAMKECGIDKKPLEYPIDSTGLWGEAVRQRCPVITNNYAAPNPLKIGYPKEHVPIIRHMNIPVFDGPHIVMVAGVGNKKSQYDERDVRELTLLINGLWSVIKKRRAEEELLQKNEELNANNEELIATEEELKSMVEDLSIHEQALRESEQKYRNVVEDQTELICRFRPDGTHIFVNDAYCRYFNKKPEQIIGHRFKPRLYPEDRELVSRLIASLTPENPVLNIAQRIIMPDGTTRWQRWNDRGIFDTNGTLKEYQSVGRDITDQKQTEDALASANRNLSLLSSITRHDINNQLSALMGYLVLLKDTSLDLTQNEYLRKISSAAERISSMIRFTKEYENIGIHAPAWQDCRIIVDTATREATLGDIIVKNDLPAGMEVLADPLIIKVFYNLIDNAVRYGGKITTIRFSAFIVKDDYVLVCEDDGYGVKADEKERIFHRGFGKNTGLGLLLAREILSITGLSIRECGNPGEGARFEIRLPLGKYREGGK